MDKLIITGGAELRGEVVISGAKNAALPELCAALLSAEPVTLLNVPKLEDVSTMLKLIRHMGVAAERGADGSVTIEAGALSLTEAPYDLCDLPPGSDSVEQAMPRTGIKFATPRK